MISHVHVLRWVQLIALSVLCACNCLAVGLTSGHYQFEVSYSPLCLNGVFPITAYEMTTGCVLRANLNATGALSGTVNIRTVPGTATGTLTSQNNVVSLHLHVIGQDPPQTASDIDAQLHGAQFVGTATANNQSGLFTMDVSAAAPLNVTFDLDLVVNQSSVTGVGTATGCAVQVPVNVTGSNGPSNCVLHIVGANLPNFIWDGSGPPTPTGFTAAWTANGFGASSSGTGLVIAATPLQPTTAVSRKTHGGTPFDITLPLTGNSGIECRSGGASNDYQVVLTFPSSVTFNGAAVTAGVGTVSGSGGSGTTTVTVNLTGVTNAQRITLTLLNVSNGTNTGDLGVPMGVLVGDTNGDGFVNSGDALQTRNRSGQTTDTTNFRSDVNADGFINSGDTTVVRARSGTFLP